MAHGLLLSLGWLGAATASPSLALEPISPSDVFAQVVQIERETALIARHFKLKAERSVTPVQAQLQPRHVWQKAYLVLMKINAFRRLHGEFGVAPVEIEAGARVEPRHPWGQTQRILAEVRIVRRMLGVPGEVEPLQVVAGKRPLDVFNKLSQVQAQWNALLGGGFDPSYSYAEAMRINEDVNTILRFLGVFDDAVPPPKAAPAGSGSDAALRAVFVVMGEIQRLQRLAGIETTDFGVFRKSTGATPDDVFNMVGMALAELQPIKARVGAVHAITPAATYYETKQPADVAQLLGYVAAKLRLVKTLGGR